MALVSKSDIETWRRVQREISDTARRLCAGSCGDAEDMQPCKGCGAGQDRDWQRDAISVMTRQAT